MAQSSPLVQQLAAGKPSPSALQAAFVQALARQTGLDPRVLNAQAVQEGAYAPNGTGGFNFLNLQPKAPGVSYSGAQETTPSPGGFARFPSLNDAVKETAYWINQMPNYAPVKATVGQPVAAQLAAIAKSPWDQGGYGKQLGDTYNRLYGSNLSTAPQQPSAGVAEVLGAARGAIGTPYSWGGGGPQGASLGIEQGAHTKGFDCSGLVQYAMAKAGVTVGGDTYSQYAQGHPVDRAQLQPGDAVFFEPTAKGPGHVAIYAGDGKVIAAPHTGTTVQVQSLDELSSRLGWVGARRYVQGGAAGAAATSALSTVGAKALTQPKTAGATPKLAAPPVKPQLSSNLVLALGKLLGGLK